VRRLSIIDVAGGHQPIPSEDGTIVATLNGEIYNFQDLRRELESSGHRFTTRSDTEVLVHAYEEWGDGMLTRLVGMFAIALWDDRRERLLLARDRMGEKPLYWEWSTKGLSWGSEAKALLEQRQCDAAVNPVALHHYLTLQYVPDPLTIFAGMNRLQAGHCLVLEKGQAPRVSRWWQLAFEPKWHLSDREAGERARALLETAVERCVISEVPFGAFLSGGVDSSVVVGLMSRRLASPVRTYSIAFEEPGYSEAVYARQAAERFRTDHHEFVFSASDLVATLDGVIGATDEPFADPAAVTVYQLARQASRSITVALTGDGGDETLAGYSRYVLDRSLAPYFALPAWVTGKAVPAVLAALPEPTALPEDRNPITGLKRLSQAAAITSKASLVRWGSYFGHDQKQSVYTDRWHDELARVDTAAMVADFYDQAEARTALDRTLAADHATYLAGDLLTKTDRMTMAHSVESRSPLLDRDWVEWTARLAAPFKVRRLQTKWLLRHAFRDLVPAAIASRSKQGFSVPIGLWLRAGLRGWSRERLIGNARLAEWFRPAAIDRLLREHDSGRINHGKRIWALLMFAVWLDQRAAHS
jgi:asparagine synthase (glutamine-hydrolysing)